MIALLASTAGIYAAQAPADSFYAAFNNRSFVDEDNMPFDSGSLLGKTTLIHFFFTGCSTVCPTQTAQLNTVMNQLPKAFESQVQFVSVSLQPLVDTPEKLTEFRQRFQLDHDNWQFLTGNYEDTRSLASDLQLIVTESTSNQIDHRTELWLVNRQGILVQQYDGNSIDVPRLVSEITQLSQL